MTDLDQLAVAIARDLVKDYGTNVPYSVVRARLLWLGVQDILDNHELTILLNLIGSFVYNASIEIKGAE